MRLRRLLAFSVVIGVVTAAGVSTLATAEARRIVSVVPAATEMLFAIGAGSRVVAVSSYDSFPPEVARLPRIGALLDPDVERILSLKPDLAVVYATQTDLIAQLERARIPVFPYRHGGLPDVTATMRALGARAGMTREADSEATRLEQRLRQIAGRVRGRQRPKTLLVFSREPRSLRDVYASGGKGFLHDLLTVAGGDDIFADVPRESVQATTETILARRPEVIIEVRATRPSDLDRETQVWSALSSVPAVRSRRVHFLIGDEMVVPGPRIANAAERLARALHPDAF